MSIRSLYRSLGVVGAALCIATAAAVPACSATSDNNTFNGNAGGNQPSSGSGNAGGGDILIDAGSSDAKDDTGSCAGEHTLAKQLPLDMYIMLDQSGSMGDPVTGGTKWTAVTGALASFMQQPNLDGISVGIQYFPLTPGGQTCPPFCASDADCMGFGPCFIFICTGCAAAGDSCDAIDYAVPDVEIAPLPGVEADILASITAHGPTGSTPTSAALQGAVDHAKWWAQQPQAQNHVVIDVLATDGDPTECTTDINGISAIAAAGAASNPKVLTFVIGVGSLQTNLDAIAQAGGTDHAFIIDVNQNVNQQFLDALNAIRGSVLTCTYEIPVPEAGAPDYSSVNVQYIPGNGGPAQDIPKVLNKAACPPNGDGWYYDDNANPTQIIVCDATCDKISADTMGQVDIVLGCKSIIN